MAGCLRRLSPALLLLPLAFFFGARIACAESDARHPTVDLSAEASRRAPNDLAVAMAYVESTDAQPSRLAQRVNEAVAAALVLARRSPDVAARSTNVHTVPVYAKDGRKIEAWRMRSEILLESRNIAALSELLGQLQNSLAVSQLTLRPAPDTERATADDAVTDAIRAFETRAKAISATLGKRYRIRHLAVAYGGGPVRPMMRAAAMQEDAAAMPIEAGDSEVTVGVSGTIELID